MGIHLVHLAKSIGRTRQWLNRLHQIAGTYIPDYLADMVELSAGDSQGRQRNGLSYYQAAVLGKLIEDLTKHSPADGPLPKNIKLPSAKDFHIEPTRYSKNAMKAHYQNGDDECTSHNLLKPSEFSLSKLNPS